MASIKEKTLVAIYARVSTKEKQEVENQLSKRSLGKILVFCSNLKTSPRKSAATRCSHSVHLALRPLRPVHCVPTTRSCSSINTPAKQVKPEGLSTDYGTNTRRKPTKSPRPPGPPLPRYAERQPCAPLPQQPPRNTRPEPLSSPAGLSAIPLFLHSS